jgi:hypothetical protein
MTGSVFPKSILIALIFLYLAGCSPKGRVTAPENSPPTLSDYLPIIAGNTWAYSAFTVNGLGDTSYAGPIELSIFRTNVLIGGQPNAFVVKTDDKRGRVSYLAFSISGNTLLHYLGGSKTFLLQENSIAWVSGGVGGAVVEVNQTQKYHISDNSGKFASFIVSRPPDSSIAAAAMSSPDTLEITGMREGRTAFQLKAAGGGVGDTMTVAVGTSNDVPAAVTSPFLPWIPLWQLTDSSSAQAVFSRDTTFSFRCIADSAQCTDELFYMVADSYLGEETVQAGNSALKCDRFRIKITLLETITYTDKTQSRVLFSGPSTDFTIDMWLARGTGFVKGIAGGNSLSPVAAMGGELDSTGVLNGYYISPRIAYASVPVSGGSYREYFYVNDSALATTGTLNEFVLTNKNFR